MKQSSVRVHAVDHGINSCTIKETGLSRISRHKQCVCCVSMYSTFFVQMTSKGITKA